jgi:hypothetical protein
MQGTWRMEIEAETSRKIKLQEADHERLCKLATGSKNRVHRGWTVSISNFINQITTMKQADHSIEPIELQ